MCVSASSENHMGVHVIYLTDSGRTKPHPKPKKGKKAATASPRKAASPEPEENLCLLRASNGKKHISTVVSAKEVTRFQLVSFSNENHSPP